MSNLLTTLAMLTALTTVPTLTTLTTPTTRTTLTTPTLLALLTPLRLPRQVGFVARLPPGLRAVEPIELILLVGAMTVGVLVWAAASTVSRQKAALRKASAAGDEAALLQQAHGEASYLKPAPTPTPHQAHGEATYLKPAPTPTPTPTPTPH